MHHRIEVASLMRRQGVRRAQVRMNQPQPTFNAEQAYYRALMHMINGAMGIVKQRLLPAALAAKRRLTKDASQEESEFNAALAFFRLAMEYTLVRATENMINRVLGLESQRHTRRFTELARQAFGIDLRSVLTQTDLQDEFALMARRNANLIKNLSEDTIRRIEQAVVASVLRGGTQKDLENQLVRDFGLLRKRARLIARDQTSKLTSDLNRLRQQQIGVREYTWRTAMDERVRAAHRPMEGKVCKWDDETVYRNQDETAWHARSSIGGVELHPGEDYNCRCVAIAVLNLKDRN